MNDDDMLRCAAPIVGSNQAVSRGQYFTKRYNGVEMHKTSRFGQETGRGKRHSEPRETGLHEADYSWEECGKAAIRVV